ncbi:MAG: class II aldolase/adducin family protein [Clostridiales bacterium]|nr:class II aldolase/adducin family protein [Clostridiales bacterium]
MSMPECGTSLETEQYGGLIEEIKKAAVKFYRLRYQMSNGGNLSVRIPGKDWMLVKGTDVAFDEVDAATLVVTDFDGTVVAGNRKPSKEALLHGAIYRANPSAGAIMHCHSPYATAWAATHDALEFSTHHSKMKLGGCVPVFDTHSYAVPKEYFPMILKAFADNPEMNAFLLRAHGQVTTAKTMREAAYLAELVEETAQICLLASGK